MQRQQGETEADEKSAEVVRLRIRAPAEHQHAHEDENGRGRRDIEGQQLNDQGRADICPQHHGQRRHEIDEAAGGEAGDHQARRRAALQDGGHPHAGQERPHARLERRA